MCTRVTFCMVCGRITVVNDCLDIHMDNRVPLQLVSCLIIRLVEYLLKVFDISFTPVCNSDIPGLVADCQENLGTRHKLVTFLSAM
jgi:hypothetical protein